MLPKESNVLIKLGSRKISRHLNGGFQYKNELQKTKIHDIYPGNAVLLKLNNLVGCIFGEDVKAAINGALNSVKNKQ